MRVRLGYELGEEDEYVDAKTLEELEPAVAYRSPVAVCVMRLSVRGITLESAEREYEVARGSILEAFARDREVLASEGKTLGDVRTDPNYLDYDLETNFLEGNEVIYQSLDFKTWLTELRLHVASRINQADELHESDPSVVPSDFQSYISKCGEEEGRHLGFLPGIHPLLLRCLLEVVDRTAIVELDLSESIHDGELDIREEIAVSEPYFTILTEGKGDKWILERSLEHLYPHLASYYKFADFEASGLAGGISNHLQVVKTFIALSIRDRLIVLFDNDAVGRAALLKLSTLTVPGNVRLLALPDLKRAMDYPTIGPDGLGRSNVNSQAVSIEFFFGADILEKDGVQTPVRWKSFQQEIGLYQGELERKTELKAAFDNVLSKPELHKDHDWSDMRQLFRSIFQAYMD
jgi:hypothetical protein